jgi:hypothetical protein
MIVILNTIEFSVELYYEEIILRIGNKNLLAGGNRKYGMRWKLDGNEVYLNRHRQTPVPDERVGTGRKII